VAGLGVAGCVASLLGCQVTRPRLDPWRFMGGSHKTFGLHKMLGIYRVAAQLEASRVVLSSTELVM
jgi:hypothetical protein